MPMKEKLRFSVVMSVYKNDNPIAVREALESIVSQTLPPDEIVVVADGIISEDLEAIIKNMDYIHTELTFLPQEVNKGLGAALRIAVENAKHEYVARMDSDDISLPDRFEKQMRCFEKNDELSVVGGMITEFVDTPDNITGKRVLPCDDKDIKRFMRSRSGINHVTAIFKKKDLLRVGNYQPFFGQEDYYLWMRMIKQGCVFLNIPDVVVNVRSGKIQYARRGGYTYVKSQLTLFNYMYKEGVISLSRLFYNYFIRIVVQLFMPNQLRTWIYQKFLRQQMREDLSDKRTNRIGRN